MFWKDQLVSGMWKDLISCGALRLVSKNLNVLQFFQNFVRPLNLVWYPGSSVSLAYVWGLHRDKTSVYEMGHHRNAAKSGGGTKGCFPHSVHGGELGDTAQDHIEEAALMEEELSQMGVSPRMPFRFTQLSRSPFVHSLSLACWWAHSTTPDDQMHYCIHSRVTLEEGRGDQPPPSHAWSGSLIADILQKACSRDQITEAVVLVLGGGNPVLWKVLAQGGASL